MNHELTELADALFAAAQRARQKSGQVYIDLPSPAEITAELPALSIDEAENALRIAGAAPVWCGGGIPCWKSAHEHVRWIAPEPPSEGFEERGASCIDVPKLGGSVDG